MDVLSTSNVVVKVSGQCLAATPTLHWGGGGQKIRRPIVQVIFQILAIFLNGHNSKNFGRNQLKLSTWHKDIKNIIKIWGDFGAIFWKKSMGLVQGIF